MRPRMVVIAGPPGSGKSTFFPVSDLGLDGFNADDRAAALNGGSYQNISLDIRARTGKEFEHFVVDHIKTKRTFAIETTLRTDITFRQAQLAREAGFQIEMVYVCAGDFDSCLHRVIARGFLGGHSAPADQLKKIHSASLRNLPRAIREMDKLRVYDSRLGETPSLVLEAISGKIEFMRKPVPVWLTSALDAN